VPEPLVPLAVSGSFSIFAALPVISTRLPTWPLRSTLLPEATSSSSAATEAPPIELLPLVEPAVPEPVVPEPVVPDPDVPLVEPERDGSAGWTSVSLYELGVSPCWRHPVNFIDLVSLHAPCSL